MIATAGGAMLAGVAEAEPTRIWFGPGGQFSTFPSRLSPAAAAARAPPAPRAAHLDRATCMASAVATCSVHR